MHEFFFFFFSKRLAREGGGGGGVVKKCAYLSPAPTTEYARISIGR